MHHCDKRRAIANIGSELERRGWTMFGWKDDRSDLMTDYYDPESWDGVATHTDYPGVIVCVGVSDYDVKRHSGKPEYRTVSEPDQTCEHCNGSGNDPSGWTLAAAREDPVRFNKELLVLEYGEEQAKRVTNLMPSIVSPIPFRLGGPLMCRKCHGRGHSLKQRKELVCEWPTFQENPPHKTWHVEKDGKVIAGGVGLSKCAQWGRDADSPGRVAAAALVDRIEKAVKGTVKAKAGKTSPSGNGAASSSGSGVKVKQDRDWVWVHFPAKPAEEVRDALKNLGGRWSRKRQAWYFTDASVKAQIEAVVM